MMKSERHRTFCVSMPAHLKAAAKRAARADGRNTSSFLRKLIEDYAAEHGLLPVAAERK
jgi:hypothetical protein